MKGLTFLPAVGAYGLTRDNFLRMVGQSVEEQGDEPFSADGLFYTLAGFYDSWVILDCWQAEEIADLFFRPELEKARKVGDHTRVAQLEAWLDDLTA